MKDFWLDVLNFAQHITTTVGDKLIADFGKIQAVRKSDGTLVTEADKWADEQIRLGIAHTFPHHGVLTEETAHIFPPNDWCWIVDPIDGTTNFTRGIPIWGISLGLLYRGTPVFGYVYLPQLHQSFHGYWYGSSGLSGPIGAYRNGEPIHTSNDNPSLNHLFNLCARSTEILHNPFPCKIRLIGVASYNILLVASGASLGGLEATPKVWDIAGAWGILLAAGGAYKYLGEGDIFPLKIGENYGSRSFRSLIVAREELFSEFEPLVNR